MGMGPWKGDDFDNHLDNYGNPGPESYPYPPADETPDLNWYWTEEDEKYDEFIARFGTGNPDANDEKNVY